MKITDLTRAPLRFWAKRALAAAAATLFIHLFLEKNETRAQPGLQAEYFSGRDFGEKKHARTDAAIDFDWRGKTPAPGLGEHEFSVRWTGRLTPPETGEYLFVALVDDGARVFIDGRKVIDAWGEYDSQDFTGKIRLEGGRSYDLKVEYFNGILEGEMHLRWQLPSEKPMLGGLAGYNDRPIGAKYFSQKEKEAERPAPPPVAKPVEKPVQKRSKPEAKPTLPPPAELKKSTPKNIQFVKSKAEMLPESLPELDRLLSLMRDYPALRVTIEGHTDNVGDAAKNQELSEQRAQAVADYLTKNGIDAARLTAVGFGGSRPVASNDQPETRAQNRRVEFKFGD